MHFDQVDKTYEKISITQGSAAEKLIAQLPKQQYKDILDIGCASGVNTQKLIGLLDKGGLYEGIDVSNKMIDQAQKKYPNKNFSAVSIEEFASDKQYDLLFCNSVFYYFNSPENVLSKASALLKQGGIFAIQSQMALCPEFVIAHHHLCQHSLTRSQMASFTFPAKLLGSREYMFLLSQQDFFELQSMICMTDKHELTVDQALDVFKSGPAIPYLSDKAYSKPKPEGFDSNFLNVIRESLTNQAVNGKLVLHSPRVYIILKKI